ncbi:MAG TPA: hypothetical protein VFN79_07510 [Steroidobacteraceae bacterium]|nr:hypothetical protein [Steroidobacteraceae bacterium]
MVRVVALALLLANLLYFGWAEWIGVPAPPPPSPIAGLPRLKLLSDLPPAQRAALAQKQSLPKPPPVCVSVGPFDDPTVAAKAVAVLQAKSFSPQERTARSAAIKRFWVHLDGFANDAAVTRALHTLEHGGIDDAEAMPPAAGGRQISLGLFSDKAHAERRAKAVRKMGLEPKVDQRTVPGTVYWLDLTLANSSVSVPLKDVSDLQPAGAGSAVSVQPCPGNATPTPPTGSATSTAPAPQSAFQAAPPFPAAVLPRCKAGGHGPVPCIASESRDLAHPSVL